LRDAALHDRLKELAERIAVAEPAVSVLRQDEEVWLHDSSITWLFSR
jgi:DNA-binding Xre family transcriptional regulator